MTTTDQDLRRWALRRARQLRWLYVHAAIYAVVTVGLLLINAVTRDEPGTHMFGGQRFHHGGGDWWVIWPALAWGMAVAIHAVVVLIGGTTRMESWEDRKVEELVRREKERSGV